MNLISNYPHVPLSPVNPQTQSLSHDNQVREIIAQPSQTEGYPREPGIARDQEQHRPQNRDQTRQRLGDAEGSSEAIELRESDSDDPINGVDSSTQNQDEEDTSQSAEPSSESSSDDSESDNGPEPRFTPEELEQIDQLEDRDQEVVAHEEAHARVGGQYAGAPRYDYQRGPDSQLYAVGGEVSIDLSPIPNDPTATIQKMRQVQAAALAPVEPSAQDRRVAAAAARNIQEAQMAIASGDDERAGRGGMQRDRLRESGEESANSENRESAVEDPLMVDDQLLNQMTLRNSVIAQTYGSSSVESVRHSLGAA